MVLQALQLQTPTAKALSTSVRINNFDTCFLIVLLVFEYYGTKFIFVVSAYKDAAHGVFRFCSAMNSDAVSAGNILEYGQQSLEAGAPCHFNGITTTGDDVVLVFECDTDVFLTVARTYIQISEDAFPVRRLTVEPITMIDFIFHDFCSGNQCQ